MASEKLAATAKIRELLVERMGGMLASCNSLELIYIGFLAGITEECLFRGVIQPWLEQDWGWALGLIFSNLIFALLHWITPLYALLAGIAGLYLGLTLDLGPSRDLTVPVLIHAFYDFLAFVKVAHLWRQAQSQGS
jgi:membrane protease YdiL (CAAX protease family)